MKDNIKDNYSFKGLFLSGSIHNNGKCFKSEVKNNVENNANKEDLISEKNRYSRLSKSTDKSHCELVYENSIIKDLKCEYLDNSNSEYSFKENSINSNNAKKRFMSFSSRKSNKYIQTNNNNNISKRYQLNYAKLFCFNKNKFENTLNSDSKYMTVKDDKDEVDTENKEDSYIDSLQPSFKYSNKYSSLNNLTKTTSENKFSNELKKQNINSRHTKTKTYSKINVNNSYSEYSKDRSYSENTNNSIKNIKELIKTPSKKKNSILNLNKRNSVNVGILTQKANLLTLSQANEKEKVGNNQNKITKKDMNSKTKSLEKKHNKNLKLENISDKSQEFSFTDSNKSFISKSMNKDNQHKIFLMENNHNKDLLEEEFEVIRKHSNKIEELNNSNNRISQIDLYTSQNNSSKNIISNNIEYISSKKEQINIENVEKVIYNVYDEILKDIANNKNKKENSLIDKMEDFIKKETDKQNINSDIADESKSGKGKSYESLISKNTNSNNKGKPKYKKRSNKYKRRGSNTHVSISMQSYSYNLHNNIYNINTSYNDKSNSNGNSYDSFYKSSPSVNYTKEKENDIIEMKNLNYQLFNNYQNVNKEIFETIPDCSEKSSTNSNKKRYKNINNSKKNIKLKTSGNIYKNNNIFEDEIDIITKIDKSKNKSHSNLCNIDKDYITNRNNFNSKRNLTNDLEKINKENNLTKNLEFEDKKFEMKSKLDKNLNTQNDQNNQNNQIENIKIQEFMSKQYNAYISLSKFFFNFNNTISHNGFTISNKSDYKEN